MKAIIVEEPGGLENLHIGEVQDSSGEVLIKVKYAGLNPIDVNTIKGKTNYKISPFPHIPGAEIAGIVKESKTNKFKPGDRVILYPRFFDNSCLYCISGKQHICENGGIYGATSNGGFSELFAGPALNFLKIPEDVDFEDAVGLPVGGLTSYHALIESNLKTGEKVLIVGASGNTGQYAVILSRIFGAEVYFVSRKKWLTEYGAIEWNGQNVDLIINSLGTDFFKNYLSYLNKGGRIVTFGTYTGKLTEIDLAFLYTGERKIIGSTGGTLKELQDLLKLVKNYKIKTKVWKHFKYTDIREALQQYDSKDGRIIIDF